MSVPHHLSVDLQAEIRVERIQFRDGSYRDIEFFVPSETLIPLSDTELVEHAANVAAVEEAERARVTQDEERGQLVDKLATVKATDAEVQQALALLLA